MFNQTIKQLRKRQIPAVAISLGLIMTGVFFTQQNSTSVLQMETLRGGVHTCFTRVSQTFTAKLLGDGSSYIAPEFMGVTEECFADALTLAKSLDKIYQTKGKLLNNLASDVHWFHEKIEKSATDNSEISTRFSNLEMSKNSVIAGIDEIRDTTSKRNDLIRITLVLFGTILTVFAFADWMIGTKRRVFIKRAEAQAQEILQAGIDKTPNRVEEIISDILLEHNLVACAELMSTYHSHIIDGKIKAYMRPEDFIPKVLLKKQEMPQSQTPIVANTSNTAQNDLQLSKTMSAIVDRLASKLFTQGVAFDLDMPEDLFVKATQEDVEQVIYQVILNAIQATTAKDHRKVTVRAIRLGRVVKIECIDNGQGFSADFLENPSKYFGAGLNICKELLTTEGEGISFENIMQDGELHGSRVLLTFISGENRTIYKHNVKQLIEVRKGKKRDLIKELQELTREDTFQAEEEDLIVHASKEAVQLNHISGQA